MPRLWTLFGFLAPLLTIYLASKSSHAWPYNPFWFLATHPDNSVSEHQSQQPFLTSDRQQIPFVGNPHVHAEPGENAFVRRIVAVGDLHGDMGNARKVLNMAGVIDENGDWTGNVDYFVQTGDIIDRYLILFNSL